MAWVTLQSFTDSSNSKTVVYERDDTNSGGAGTTGRHRLTIDGRVGDVAAANEPAIYYSAAQSLHYVAFSRDPGRLFTHADQPTITLSKGRIMRLAVIGDAGGA